MIEEMKTSAEWEKDPVFAGLQILDPDGWDRSPEKFDFSFYKEKITRKEFERRVISSTILWNFPKL